MPLYEYQCESCQRVHEVMQKFSDEPMKVCPECGAPVAKLISMSSFALKGSGWYATDYKKSAAPAVVTAPAGEASGASATPVTTPSTSAPSSAVAAPAATPAKVGGSGDSKS